MTTFTMLSKYILFACIFTQAVFAYKPKTVIYWGQESQGKELPLRDYCSSGDYDVIVMGFVYQFPTYPGSVNKLPGLNFASHCETLFKGMETSDPLFLNCSASIGPDITYCQSLGVQILMSFGGGVGRYGFDGTDEASAAPAATAFATMVWNMFMEGSGVPRPLGSAIIDGIDLDIEGGTTFGYITFINKLRSYFATSSRKYYIASAPQCPYPDGRLGPSIGTALGGAWMDYVFVQFYNNYCGLEFKAYSRPGAPSQFNFATWGNWARTNKINPDVKIFIGAPASAHAAAAGYVEMAELQSMVATAVAPYMDVYGGVMLWDCSNSDRNNNYGGRIASFVRSQALPLLGSSTPVLGSSAPSTPAAPSTTAKPMVAAPSTTAKPMAAAPSTTAKPMATDASITTAKPVSSMPSTPAAPLTTAAATPAAPVTTAAAKPIETTPSSPVTTAARPMAPVTTAAKPMATTASSVPITTAAMSTPSSSDQSCSLGSMKCLSDSTYSMCDRGKWANAQSCQVGLKCTPNGNVIYCQ